MNTQQVVQWLLKDPYHRIYDACRYYEKHNPDVYKALTSDAIMDLIRQKGFRIKISSNSERVCDAHTSYIRKYACIESDYHTEDLYCNSKLGNSVCSSDLGRFVKRCDAGKKLVAGDWQISLDLVKPGEFARVLKCRDNQVSVVCGNTQIADLEEAADASVVQFENDSAWIFLN